MCEQPFTIGQRGVVIGHVDHDMLAALRWVHIRCLLRDVAGEAVLALYDAQYPDS